jgi:hypothetical protein
MQINFQQIKLYSENSRGFAINSNKREFHKNWNYIAIESLIKQCRKKNLSTNDQNNPSKENVNQLSADKLTLQKILKNIAASTATKKNLTKCRFICRKPIILLQKNTVAANDLNNSSNSKM